MGEVTTFIGSDVHKGTISVRNGPEVGARRLAASTH